MKCATPPRARCAASARAATALSTAAAPLSPCGGNSPPGTNSSAGTPKRAGRAARAAHCHAAQFCRMRRTVTAQTHGGASERTRPSSSLSSEQSPFPRRFPLRTRVGGQDFTEHRLCPEQAGTDHGQVPYRERNAAVHPDGIAHPHRQHEERQHEHLRPSGFVRLCPAPLRVQGRKKACPQPKTRPAPVSPIDVTQTFRYIGK